MNNDYVKESQMTWDTIAQSFDATRRKPWDQCIDFIKELPNTSIVADIGCGNGRHLIPCTKKCKKTIGIDISKELLTIAHKKTNEMKLQNVVLVQADSVNLPMKNNTVDAVLFIATLHNIKGKENRIKSLSEIKRVLKKDGKALVSVWSRWQDKYRKQFLKKWFKHIKKEEFGDIDIYWKKHSLNIPRFYHLYSKKEFINDIRKSGLEITDIHDVKIHSKKHPDNYFVTVKK